jgi:hypothetical protein
MNGSESADILRRIAEMLDAGLATQTEPFPETDKEFAGILVTLRQSI